jgi:8-oxo-dGTP diphosphatase
MSRLRELRQQQGRTIAELALRLGVNESTLRNWERGRHLPKSATMRRKIARVLGVPEPQLALEPQPAPATKEEQPVIAAAIIVQDGRVLMTRRRFREGELVWGFPTGAVEEGESPEQAAVREVQEEVGLNIAAERRLGERVHPATKRHMVYVACDVVSGTAELVDHEELAEIAWSDLQQLTERVPGGIFEPVQEYLNRALIHA